MATDDDFMAFIAEQVDPNLGMTSRKMFGEYAVYLNGKVVALVCDNQVFVKPTAAGRAYIGDVTEAPPYPGAKPSFLIDDKIEDGPWLSELLVITERELPKPRPKKKRAAGKKKTAKKKPGKQS